MKMVQPDADGPGRVHDWNLECEAIGCKPEPNPATVVETKFPERIMVTSPSGGTKEQKLARFDLIPAQAMWKVAELYGAGAGKYEPFNWRKGYDWSLAMAALERHYNLFKGGEDIDPESGMPHMAAVVFHALTLLTFMDEQPDYDDRWTPPTSKLDRLMAEKPPWEDQ